MSILDKLTAGLRYGLVLLVAAVVAVAGCGSDEPNGGNAPARTFVGAVAGTQALIGLAVEDDGDVTAYVCDSDEISVWLRGTSGQDGAVSAGSDSGDTLIATIDDGTATGNLLIDGAAYPFTASLGTGVQGIYVAEHETDRFTVSAAWVLGPDDALTGSVQASSRGSGPAAAQFREPLSPHNGFPKVKIWVTAGEPDPADGPDVGEEADPPPPSDAESTDEELLDLRAELLFPNDK